MSVRIEDLVPEVARKVRAALDMMKRDERLEGAGVTVAVVETRRELVTQMAYYSRGRMKPEDVRAMYKAAGLYTPTDEECRTPNTWTLASNHIGGRAADLAPVKDGKIWWTAPDNIWEIMGEIGEEAGLSWGGRWKERDLPHFEA